MPSPEHLGFNYRGTKWSDGFSITRVVAADGSYSEGTASLGYIWTGTIWTPVTIPATVTTGKKTVTTAGTQVQLTATPTTIQSLVVKALIANTGLIYVGDSNVASTNGFQLSPDDSVAMDLVDLSTIWIDSAVNGEGVSYLAVS